MHTIVRNFVRLTAVPLQWDVEDLCTTMSKKPRGLNMEYENTLLENFRPFCDVDDVLEENVPILLRPGIIVDRSGNILAWALPGILSEERQVRI